ncbi:ABC transporter permease [Paenarthrobacter nitroguajacolicus]|uniref:ABC transporter permease n=1 Tax=Paenarthrobacter nitroguajacolicus TaxID=211146 RepID=UPI002858B532|nr:ABC transporter permease [Paenarthrobacter nitroguajacolicus]MDR6639501.1 peptide/nickel transport system permease protein [Paenarthrobacter nitroguajacolicus]
MTALSVTKKASGLSVRRNTDPILVLLACAGLFLLLLAITGPYLAPYPPEQTDILAASQGASTAHALGTDSLGRDILSRLLTGARLSFIGPLIIVTISTVCGTALAIAAAWKGGWLDQVIDKSLNILFAIPGVLVAVLAAAIFGAGFWAPICALSIVYIPFVAKVVRSYALRERKRPYIEAYQLAGLSPWRICTRHILGNVMPIVLAQATLGLGSALMDFGAINFLGLGVQPPASEWGLMVSDGRSEILNGAFQQSLSAGTMIVISVVIFNLLGERLTARIGAAL